MHDDNAELDSSKLTNQRSSKTKSVLLPRVFISITIALAFFGLIIGFLLSQPGEQRQITMKTPAIQKPQETQPAFVFKDNVVSYAQTKKGIILHYNGKFFEENSNNSYSLEDKAITVTEYDKYDWHDILEMPSEYSDDPYNELIDFKMLPNKEGFLFITRWSRMTNNRDQSLYLYEISSMQLTLLKKFTEYDPNNTDLPKGVPLVHDVSNDGQYIALKIFGCWNCGASYPSTSLLRLADLELKSIGRTADFMWKEDGEYEYKKAIELPCPTLSDGSNPGCYSAPFEDPKNLPLQFGSF